MRVACFRRLAYQIGPRYVCEVHIVLPPVMHPFDCIVSLSVWPLRFIDLSVVVTPVMHPFDCIVSLSVWPLRFIDLSVVVTVTGHAASRGARHWRKPGAAHR